MYNLQCIVIHHPVRYRNMTDLEKSVAITHLCFDNACCDNAPCGVCHVTNISFKLCNIVKLCSLPKYSSSNKLAKNRSERIEKKIN